MFSYGRVRTAGGGYGYKHLACAEGLHRAKTKNGMSDSKNLVYAMNPSR